MRPKKVQNAIHKMQKQNNHYYCPSTKYYSKANRIIVLRHGYIIEQGTHQELLDYQGEYAQLYKHQFKY